MDKIKRKKGSVGRPFVGRIHVGITLLPEIVEAIAQGSAELGLTRGQYVEMLVRQTKGRSDIG